MRPEGWGSGRGGSAPPWGFGDGSRGVPEVPPPGATSLCTSADEFEEGWLVVRGPFYELVQKSPRGYKLSSPRNLFLVNVIMYDPPP